MILIKLFKLLFLSYLRQEKLRTLFTIISILLGVSLYVSTRITTENILMGFKAATSFISDSDTIRILSDSGSISEDLIPTLLAIPEVDGLTPISTRFVQAYAANTDLGYVNVVGLDILAIHQIITPDPVNDNALDLFEYLGFFLDKPIEANVSRKLADVMQNAPLLLLINGEYKPIFVKEILENSDKMSPYGDYLIALDIKNFQNLFNTYHSVDQLRVKFNTDSLHSAMRKVAEKLPKPYSIVIGNENTHYAEDLTATFRFNFNIITCLALLVTAIIIYNAFSFYILERRKDFGIILMLGAKPATLFLSSLLAGFILAIFCATLGLFLGFFISKFSIQTISQTFSTLYIPMRVTEVHLSRQVVMEVFIMLISITLVVSILPSMEIFRIPLRQSTFYQTYEDQFKTNLTKTTFIGFCILLLSFISLIPSILKLHASFVYLSLIGFALSSAFFLPILLVLFLTMIRKILGRYLIEAVIAIEHILATMRKHVVAIAAMSIAMALYLSVMIIIDSTQYTASNWLNHVLSADIYIGENAAFNFSSQYFPDEFVQYLKKNSDIKTINFITHKDIIYQGKPLRVIGTTFSTIGKYFNVQFIQPMTATELSTICESPANVFISENFARLFGLKIGDPLIIPGNHGPFEARIANISYNYLPYQNILLISNTLFASLYDNARAENAMIYLNDPTAYNTVISAIKESFPNLTLYIQYQSAIKKIADTMMEQTFAIAKVIVSIILVLTALTLFNTLEQLILSRRHEFSVFWSLGASDYTLYKLCLWESFFIYTAAILNAIIPTVIVISLIFNYLDLILFGTEIVLKISYSSIFLFILLLFLIVLIDGFIPALKARKLINAEGLRYE